MKRNMDLIRALLLKLEAQDTQVGSYYSINAYDDELHIEGHDPNEVALHMLLLIDAGYLDAEQHNGPRFGYRGITWEGHDFLDSVRDPKTWIKTKQAAEGAGGFTVDLLKDIAKGLIKKQVEDYSGVKL